jgi:hypothetical protein
MTPVSVDPSLAEITTALQCSKCDMVYYARTLWKLDDNGNFVKEVDC